MDVHDLRILLKVATGIHIQDEHDSEIDSLVERGMLYKTVVGYDVSSETLQKLDRICGQWEAI